MKAGTKIFSGLITIILIILGTGIFTLIAVSGQISMLTRVALIILYSLAIAACTVTGLVFVKTAVKELTKMKKLSERVADGDLDFDIEIDNKALAPFKKLQKNITGLESETAKIWEDIKSGKMDVRSDTSIFSGEFRKIASEFNEIIDMVEERKYWYESILDAVPFPIHVTDENMKWTYMNKAFETLMVNGKVIKDRGHGYGMDCCNAGANICNTEKCGIKQLLKGKNESYFDWAGMNCKQDTAYLTNKEGKKVGFVEVVTDLTAILRSNSYTKAEAQKLEKSLHQIAEGNLTLDYIVAESDDYTKDERKLFLEIHSYLSEAVNSISGYIGEISQCLDKIVQGDLKNDVTHDFKGDYSQIRDSLNGIIAGLNDVMGNISISADQVASGSSQVADGSQALAQGATEQASAIEQLTASVTEIASKTRENAKAAEEAKTITEKSRSDAETGSIQMQKLLNSMAEINESSEGISKIVKVIDEIAFQTNMLALNAAVEAARAGQYGKGFAVVAEEVRNLAARSSNAVSETTTMIQNSIQKSQAGSKIAAETAESFKNIVEGAKKSAKLVEVIAGYSNEQATGIAQINKGLEQVSQVVQTNSATSEESAASSEELSAQAAELKRLLSRFKLKNASISDIRETSRNKPVSIGHAQAAVASGRKISLSAESNKYL